jgi:hypothetical protein
MLPKSVDSGNYEIGHPEWRFIISRRAIAHDLLQWVSLKGRTGKTLGQTLIYCTKWRQRRVTLCAAYRDNR